MVRARFQCRDCWKRGRGGYFSVKNYTEGMEVKCPYCGSSNVKRLG